MREKRINKNDWISISRRRTERYSRECQEIRGKFLKFAQADTRASMRSHLYFNMRVETRFRISTLNVAQWDLAGWRGKIRFERTSGRFRLGSLVLRINQLCLSVFHRAGGELISFPLNTNFFSGRKPISIKMARAFRILPDYKRLPPLPPPPPSTVPSQIRSSTALALRWCSYTPCPFPHLFCRLVPFFFHVRLQSDAVAAASSDSIAESLIPNWSDPNFGAAARPFSLDTPLISLPFILCFALPTSESRISDKYNVDYFWMRSIKMYLASRRRTIYLFVIRYSYVYKIISRFKCLVIC